MYWTKEKKSPKLHIQGNKKVMKNICMFFYPFETYGYFWCQYRGFLTFLPLLRLFSRPLINTFNILGFEENRWNWHDQRQS